MFRANEAAKSGYDEVSNYFLRNLSKESPDLREREPSPRADGKWMLDDIIGNDIGPAVNSYPIWHPLMFGNDMTNRTTTPSKGYRGLDHTRYFVNGFITCPYGDDNAQAVIDSVNELAVDPNVAVITAKKLDFPLYDDNAKPVLVRCNWTKPEPTPYSNFPQQIPLEVALPLLLECTMPCWKTSEVGETWENMRYYFLGSPHGKVSSLFVSQETGQAMKKIWESLLNTGMFGPICKTKPGIQI